MNTEIALPCDGTVPASTVHLNSYSAIKSLHVGTYHQQVLNHSCYSTGGQHNSFGFGKQKVTVSHTK